MEQIRKWIQEWFLENSNVNEEDYDVNENYIEQGWIDSFQFLDLISEVEEHFNIAFSDEDFEKIELLTAKGMEQIVFVKKK